MKRWKAAVALTASLALVGACGSDDSSSSSASGSNAASSSAAGQGEAGEIVIGSIGSFTGAAASSIGPAQDVIKAWAQTVNDNGGINGRKVRLVVKDNAGSAASSGTMIRELVEKEKVVAIVGNLDVHDQSWAEYVAEKNIPVLGGTSLSIPFMSNPTFFPQGTNGVALNYGVNSLARSAGPKFGILYCSSSPACGQAAEMAQGMAPSMDLEIPFAAKVDGASPDFTALCERVKTSGVDSYTISATSSVVTRIAGDCAAQGVTARQVSLNGTVDRTWLDEPALEGALVAEPVFPFFDESNPGVKAYRDALTKYAPQHLDSDGPMAFYAWVSGKLFEKAVEGIDGEVTSQAIKESLWTFKDETLGGIAPPLTYTKDQPTLVNCYYKFTITNSEFATLEGGKYECAPDEMITGILSQM